MINVLLINESAKPITIISFSSKGLKSMNSYTINDSYSLEVHNSDIYFLKNHNFTLPITIQPYEAVQKRIMLLATDHEIALHCKKASKTIKIYANTSRKNIFLKNSKSFKVTVTNINHITNNDDRSINEEPKPKHIDLGTIVINPRKRTVHAVPPKGK